MGRLSPQDIRDQDFKQSPLGYSKEQVNEFLEAVAGELEILIQESNKIHAENKEAHLALTTYTNVEESLKETLLLAQKTAQETLKNAQSEAENVVRKAHTEKESMLFDARQDLVQIQSEIRNLLARRDSILLKLKNNLKANLTVLEEEFSKHEDEEVLRGQLDLGDEPIVDFSRNDLTVEDLPPAQPESEISDTQPEPPFED